MTVERHTVIESLLLEIERGTDRSDRIAAVIHIDHARRTGEITDRDARRLVRLLAAISGGDLPLLRTG